MHWILYYGLINEHVRSMKKGKRMIFIIFGISIISSIIGALCGIGGGVIIKPVLDAFGYMSIPTTSFLSGCTVLSMTAYSVFRELKTGGAGLDIRHILPISIGAAIGGVTGKTIFHYIVFNQPLTMIGITQSGVLAILIAGTIWYSSSEHTIQTLRLENGTARILAGLMLGLVSAFLGIGGGPFNLVVLSFFFSTKNKEAVISSLFIILVAQTSSLLLQASSNSIPDFSWGILAVMVLGGVLGAIIGRRISEQVSAEFAKRCFRLINWVILLLCLWNIVQSIRHTG